jgi:glutathionyl-hydroquinone reductase
MAADYYIITVFSDFDENEYTIADAINLGSACLLYCIGFNLKGESVENACQKTFEHLDSNITPTDLDEIQEACFDMVVR